MENVVWAKLSIQPGSNNSESSENSYPLEAKAQLYHFFETEGCPFDDVLLSLHKVDLQVQSVGSS